jgi:AMMECR1 domain-containing protein
VLSAPKALEYSDVHDLRQKIRIGIDGVVLKQGSHKATFLPQVWEDLPSFELFFSHLCQKAGLAHNCLSSHPQIEVYHVEKYKEDDLF